MNRSLARFAVPSVAGAVVLLAMAGGVLAKPVAQPAAAPAQPVKAAEKLATAPAAGLATAHKAFMQEIPAAAFKLEMLPIPGSADGTIKPFFMSKTEITWDAFDSYAYRLDEEAVKAAGNAAVDAVTRPSKPYLPPDRGFGHEGFAAICLSYQNAAKFCEWLSAHTGRTYRLATEAEWEHACRGGAATDAPMDAKALAEVAWFADNAQETPHAVGKKKANGYGLVDMLGNVKEWVTGRDGKPVTKGGSYNSPAEQLTVTAREPQVSAWNASDPQVPKSKWWLADGSYVGFRIVCEVKADEAGAGKGEKPAAGTSASPAAPAATGKEPATKK